MEQSTNVDLSGDKVSVSSDICHICECEFSLDDEGGACGHIGILLVVFCPTCHAGLYDMYKNWYGEDKDGKIVLQSDIIQPNN